MKIKKSELKQIIKEELEAVMEDPDPYMSSRAVRQRAAQSKRSGAPSRDTLVKNKIDKHSEKAKEFAKDAAKVIKNPPTKTRAGSVQDPRDRPPSSEELFKIAFSEEQANKMLKAILYPGGRAAREEMDVFNEDEKKKIQQGIVQIYTDELEALLGSAAAIKQYQAPKPAGTFDRLKAAIGLEENIKEELKTVLEELYPTQE
tara:strand:- start:423 stop:1028 length:606 start_codon:yes stop_codon:yes gene_type:complete